MVAAIVLDASAALSLVLPDEKAPGDNLADRISAVKTIWVPQHWKLEVVNALLMAFRRKRLGAGQLSSTLELVGAFPTTVDQETADRASGPILALARDAEL